MTQHGRVQTCTPVRPLLQFCHFDHFDFRLFRISGLLDSFGLGFSMRDIWDMERSDMHRLTGQQDVGQSHGHQLHRTTIEMT